VVGNRVPDPVEIYVYLFTLEMKTRDQTLEIGFSRLLYNICLSRRFVRQRDSNPLPL